ncbi:MAG TPA: Kazal-type serine protease inhibitor domain-containing protein [Polyangia bacterium]
MTKKMNATSAMFDFSAKAIVLTLVVGCGSNRVDIGEQNGDARAAGGVGGSVDAPVGGAGTTASSTSTPTGGVTTIGGNTALGGNAALGGNTGSAGIPATGGSSKIGGASGLGGLGGSTAAGGSTAIGGASALGGSTPTGGTTRTGGSVDAGVKLSIPVGEVGQHQSCVSDDDCHIVMTNCSCVVVDTEVAEVIDPIVCTRNNCPLGSRAKCNSGQCTLLLSVDASPGVGGNTGTGGTTATGGSGGATSSGGTISTGGTTGNSKACALAGPTCVKGNFCNYTDGTCGETGASGTCTPNIAPGGCTADYNPVCGCDGITYSNACMLSLANVSLRSSGECRKVPDAGAKDTAPSAAALCTATGGTITTTSCCLSASDFPNSCLDGACGCAPTSSHDVNTCSCPTGCFVPGTGCVGAAGTCTVGADQTCNDSLAISSVHGRCLSEGRCVCYQGFALLASGKCQ